MYMTVDMIPESDRSVLPLTDTTELEEAARSDNPLMMH
jgi:hypothetical protein